MAKIAGDGTNEEKNDADDGTVDGGKGDESRISATDPETENYPAYEEDKEWEPDASYKESHPM
jgi:hypothetical protein